MTKSDQQQFTLRLCDSLKNIMLEKIKHVPENWDGFEIRQLLTDTVSEQSNWCRMPRGRKRLYNNTRAITSQL